MKKYILLLIIVINVFIGSAQSTTEPFIKTELPTILPPSPTVAALMKFEEVPVSNYTGIPDISIPLFNSPTLSKDITVDISLKYNPSSVAAEERASDVGLGWSLLAGGTISRTVRGIPDEFNVEKAKGVYNDSYYQFMDLFTHPVLNDTIAEEFQFESNIKGKYDSEHDLWQYNFMGKMGRFYIKKNLENGQLEVVKLDDSVLKIVNVYDTTAVHKYVPKSFEIYDTAGYKYVFDVAEVTDQNTYTEQDWYSVDGSCGFIPSFLTSNISPTTTYKSAFHLSKVYDNNENLLIELFYNDDHTIYKEIVIDETIKESKLTNVNELSFYQGLAGAACEAGEAHQCLDGLNAMLRAEPKSTLVKSERNTNTRKLTQINIEGMAKVYFKFDKGRPDENLHNPDSAYVFKEMVVANWKGDSIKKFTLTHSDSKIIFRRLLLSQVIESNFRDTKTMTYNLSYKQNNSTLNVGKDAWGYFNLVPAGYMGSNESFKEVNTTFCYTDVLQKIGLPTGGSEVFDYQSNSYSYQGDIAITDFDENPNNWEHITDSTLYSLDNSNLTHMGPITIPNPSSTNQKITIYPTTSGLGEGAFLVLKKNGSPVAGYTNIMCPDVVPNCGLEYTLEAGATYQLQLSVVDTVSASAAITIVRHNKKSTQENWLYGGGIRIKRIGYFDEDVAPEDYFLDIIIPKKQLNFNYNFFGTTITSGSLVFPKPLFNYLTMRNSGDFDCGTVVAGDLVYATLTHFNNYSALKTKGSDVGYKNITVSENGNGRTEFTYNSPIDFPESDFAFTLQPPFLPSENFDYKRGLMASERVYDESSRNLIDKIFNYEYEENIETTGIKLFTTTYCPDLARCLNYAQVKYCTEHQPDCFGTHWRMCFYDGNPSDFIGNKQVYEAVGWAKLISKTTKNYFYPSGSTTPNIVKTSAKYKYNPLNKQIRESSVTNSNGELLRTKYFYHTGDSPGHQNRISEIERIETYKDSTLLSKSEIVYDNGFSGNVSYLPNYIRTAKDTHALEERLEYKDYDEYGHPLDAWQYNGTKTAYIYGYNKSLPIAKLEGIGYTGISPTVISNLQLLSDADDDHCLSFPCTGNEEDLRTALNDLRGTYPNAMITTYTYDPLVGVTSITDPKAYTTYYDYDNFGRLSAVRDAKGNILSEDEYSYRTQY